MNELLLLLVIVGGFAGTMGGVAWLGTRLRRQGVGATIMGPIDEMYRPNAHRLRPEIHVMEERMVPTPSADDKQR